MSEEIKFIDVLNALLQEGKITTSEMVAILNANNEESGKWILSNILKSKFPDIPTNSINDAE